MAIDYRDIAHPEDEKVPNDANENQKAAVLLAKTLKPSDGAALQGQRCFHCGGTGFQKFNPQFTCTFCGGKGWN